MSENKTVFVLDGETRAGLAVVRSLGRAGLRVMVGSEYSHSLAGSSRFCSRAVQYSSPTENLELFAQSIRDLIIKENADVLMPVTDATTYAVLQYRELFANLTEVPLVSFKTYWAASDKISLMKTAEQINIPFPKSIFIDPASSQQTLNNHLSDLKFPVIVKPQASILPKGNGTFKTYVRFAANRDDLLRIVSSEVSFTMPYMLQEVVTGEGIGIFAFCNKGEILSIFSHHRIREKPPYGGVSVVCESTQPDPDALESSKKLLKALNWSGVAMVEFKRDMTRNNIPLLMEINARFWGSLQLAIDAEVDFPLFMYQLSQKIDVLKSGSFKQSRSRWLLGDFDHLLIRLKTPANDPRYPQKLKNKIGAVITFFLEFLKGSKIEELRYYDTRPFWYSIKIWLKH